MKNKQKGQIIVFVLICCGFLVLFLSITIGVGQTVNARMKIQNAVDAAALSGAIWQARGLNIISDLNYVLLAAAGGDIIKAFLLGGIDFSLYNTTLNTQDMIAKTFPGTAGLGYKQVFKENIENARCFVSPTDIDKMFSLRVNRNSIDLPIIGKIKLWMSKDYEYWNDQENKGPFVRLVADRGKREFIFAGKIIGLEVPAIITTAKAMPYVEAGGGGVMESIFGGGLWDPQFDAKIVPVSYSIPGIMH